MIDVLLTELPQEEYERRLAAIRKEMENRNCSLAIGFGNEYVPGDVQYITGYDPQIEASAVIVTHDTVALLGGPEGEAMFLDQRASGRWFNHTLFEIPYQDYGSLHFLSLAEVLEELGLSNIETGLLLTKTVYTPLALTEAFAAAGIRLDPAPELLAEARYRKSPLELELFERASRIATSATGAMLAAIEANVTELEVAAVGDAECKRLGAYSYGWDTMVLSGERINSIIGRSSNKQIREGELVLIGACPRFAGYASTVGRTIVVGSPTIEQQNFLEAGAKAISIAADHLQEGLPARDVDAVPREFLRANGFGDYHAYGVGHGIGFSECLEDRSATSKSDYQFPRGISISLDVGLFRNPSGLNGRFEDPYIIDHNGLTRRLTDLPMTIEL